MAGARESGRRYCFAPLVPYCRWRKSGILRWSNFDRLFRNRLPQQEAVDATSVVFSGQIVFGWSAQGTSSEGVGIRCFPPTLAPRVIFRTPVTRSIPRTALPDRLTLGRRRCSAQKDQGFRSRLRREPDMPHQSRKLGIRDPVRASLKRTCPTDSSDQLGTAAVRSK